MLLAQALKAAKVEFIVAPFEADAQMAYLAINGVVHAVITEDSDMLPYGCPRVSTFCTSECQCMSLYCFAGCPCLINLCT